MDGTLKNYVDTQGLIKGCYNADKNVIEPFSEDTARVISSLKIEGQSNDHSPLRSDEVMREQDWYCRSKEFDETTSVRTANEGTKFRIVFGQYYWAVKQ